MAEGSLTAQLAAYLVRSRGRRSADRTLHCAKRLFLDWLGSAIAGCETEPGRLLLGFAAEAAGRSATVIGRDRGSAAMMAAFANGALSHIVEMDDLHRGSVLHPGTVVIPAALATAEQRGAGGLDLLTAILLGYEVAIRVGEAVGRSHYEIWHSTATCGTFGAAAAAGTLMGLSEPQMVWALGNAGSQAAGLWQFIADGAMTKHLHAGKAAMNGWMAAALAERGFTGPMAVLEGQQGFFRATSRDAQPEKVTEGLATALEHAKIEEVSIKPHASCRHTHAAIDAALRLRSDPRFDPNRVASARVQTYRAAVGLIDNPAPANPYAAKFSMQYCVAVALLDGRGGLGEFTPERTRGSDVLGLLRRVSVEVDDALDRRYPAEWPARITVTLEDGQELTELVATPKGDPENPLSDAEVEDKFRRLLAGTRYEKRAERLVSFAWGLDHPTVVRLLPLLMDDNK